MIKFTGAGSTAIVVGGKLVGDPGFVAFVESVVRDGRSVGFDYWLPVVAELADDWSAYLTVGWCWGVFYNDVPAVSQVPEPPDGYESEGPVQ